MALWAAGAICLRGAGRGWQGLGVGQRSEASISLNVLQVLKVFYFICFTSRYIIASKEINQQTRMQTRLR